jgi:hypothetical protein
MNRKKKHRIDYPNITSAIRTVPHGEDLPVPKPPKDYILNSEIEEEDMKKTRPHKQGTTDPDFQGPASDREMTSFVVCCVQSLHLQLAVTETYTGNIM